MTESSAGGPAAAGRWAVAAWCLYDWANSAFPAVVVTFVFAAYFAQGVAVTPELGTAQWGWALSISGLALALLAPVVGAIADQSGPRKPWIAILTAVCVVASACLWWVEPDPAFVILALLLVGLGNLAFEFAIVFYNAMLPEIAGMTRIGRVSGWAWGLGYAGGLACLSICLVVLVTPEQPPFGLDKAAAEQVRIIGPFVAVWITVFALPFFLLTPDLPATGTAPGQAVRQGLAQLRRTLIELPRQGQIGRFLLARMIYTDGLNTLFAFGGIYAAGSFGMSVEEILIFGIILNVTAGLGATAFAWIDDWLGAKPSIVISLVALTLIGTAILLVESTTWFYILGAALGIFFGPAQAASRSLMARLAPPEVRNELFGLYALSGKATAFVGPALVGWVTLWSGSQRWGMATILVFFVVGLAILLPLKAGGPAGPGARPG